MCTVVSYWLHICWCRLCASYWHCSQISSTPSCWSGSTDSPGMTRCARNVHVYTSHLMSVHTAMYNHCAPDTSNYIQSWTPHTSWLRKFKTQGPRSVLSAVKALHGLTVLNLHSHLSKYKYLSKKIGLPHSYPSQMFPVIILMMVYSVILRSLSPSPGYPQISYRVFSLEVISELLTYPLREPPEGSSIPHCVCCFLSKSLLLGEYSVLCTTHKSMLHSLFGGCCSTSGSLSGDEEYRLNYKYLLKTALSRCSDKAPSSVNV